MPARRSAWPHAWPNCCRGNSSKTRNGKPVRWKCSMSPPEIICCLLLPIERPGNRLLPEPVHPFPMFTFHVWLPRAIHRPPRSQVIEAFEKASGQASRVGRPQGGRFLHRGSHHLTVQDVGLKLHEQLVVHHAAV